MTKFDSVSDVIAIAHAEMDAWGLIDTGWTFEIDTRKRSHGYCSYSDRYGRNTKVVSLSRYHIEHDSKEHVVSTIRHEIAHALHYEEYVQAGREDEFFARRFTGRKWVRKVAPHGAAWKRIARKVGVEAPSASSASNIAKNEIQPWRLVSINNCGDIEDLENGYHRFPKQLSTRYMRGRKHDTLGKMFLVKKAQWVAYINGRLNDSQLSFYQDNRNVPYSKGMIF